MLHRGFDLCKGGQRELLLPAAEGLVLRQGSEKAEPVQRVLFGNFHTTSPFCSVSVYSIMEEEAVQFCTAETALSQAKDDKPSFARISAFRAGGLEYG